MKRIGLLTVALVLALGSLGFAYAAWTDTVYIEGTVETGEVKLGIAELTLTLEDDTKRVASIEGWFVGEPLASKPHPDPDKPPFVFYEGAKFVIENAYPQILARVTYVVGNLGTIPLIISDISFVVTCEDGEELTFEWMIPPPASPAVGKVYDNRGPVDGWVMTVDFINSIGVQLEYCGQEKSQFDLFFRQPLKQDHTYTIVATIEAIQWNKYEP